jgi:hypothetical protein
MIGQKEVRNMTQGTSLSDDFVASLLRSQISALQDLLYCVENGAVDSDYLLESVRALGRKSRQIVGFCEQIKSLDHALLK